ncbi:MAG TPA: sulfite exporter TauE/SafE family protein [Chitinophagaceae bacterium]|nr:sulfite exporter TauE/SafE family protein [Chitinophagaceae bacterium]
MEILSSWSVINLLLVFTGAFILGLAKAGLRGIDMLNVTLMALVFGSKASTGIVLPLLCVADIAAVIYYHRHSQWKHFWKLVPWMAVGILIGVYAGKDMNEAVFRKVMAMIIILTVVIMVIMEIIKSENVPTHPLFAASTGVMAGITTMLGNLAGAFSNLYFLAMRLPKNHFIGTSAWLFLVINLFKLPFQVLYWKNITPTSLQTDLLLLPALMLGFFIGLKLVKRIKDDHYRKVVIVLTLIGAFVIFLKK